MAEFTGFSRQTLTFLRSVARNNDKAWFDAHRDDYERSWLAPAKGFVVAAGDALHKITPEVTAEPKVNGSIFPINRNIRFSSDKWPYEDHLDFRFWVGERRRRCPASTCASRRSLWVSVSAPTTWTGNA